MSTLQSRRVYQSEETEALSIILEVIVGTMTDKQRSKINIALGKLAAESPEPLGSVLHEIGKQVLDDGIKLLQPPAK